MKTSQSQLPEGAVIISREIRKVFDQISPIVEHDFELLTYRTKDRYNVYINLDKEQELIDTEHICCWAHARHKFKLAYEQGSDERAKIFLMLIDELFGMEKAYKAAGLTAEEIKERRDSAETNRVIADLCCRLNDMLNIKTPLSDLCTRL